MSTSRAGWSKRSIARLPGWASCASRSSRFGLQIVWSARLRSTIPNKPPNAPPGTCRRGGGKVAIAFGPGTCVAVRVRTRFTASGFVVTRHDISDEHSRMASRIACESEATLHVLDARSAGMDVHDAPVGADLVDDAAWVGVGRWTGPEREVLGRGGAVLVG